jgi:hypothetical protein
VSAGTSDAAYTERAKNTTDGVTKAQEFVVRELLSQKIKKLFCQRVGVTKAQEMILSESWCHKSSRNYFVRELVSQKLKK